MFSERVLLYGGESIIIAVVVGVLLMGIVYAFIKNNIQTRLDTEIGNLWDYTA